MGRKFPTAVQVAIDDFAAIEDKLAETDGAAGRWIEEFSLEPGAARVWDCSPDWRLLPRRMPDAMWSVILEGTGKGWIGDPKKIFTITPGQAVVFPEAALHAVWPDPGVSFRMINNHFLARAAGALDFLRLVGLSGPYRLGADGRFITNAYEAAREYARGATGWRQSMRALITQNVVELARAHGRRPESAGGPLLGRLAPVLEKIDTRFSDPTLGVAELAAEIHVSEVYLRRLFKKALGVGPVEFIRKTRVDYAARLLIGTDMKIAQVAARSGFAYPEFFFRVFRAETGTTPALYRRGNFM